MMSELWLPSVKKDWLPSEEYSLACSDDFK